MAKQLSHYLYFFSFLFLFSSYLDLLHKERVWESVTGQCHMSQSYIKISQSYIKMSQVMSHNKYGKVVYRPCSSCISSVQKLMETLSSSPCQLGLGVVLRHLSLSSYKLAPKKKNIFCAFINLIDLQKYNIGKI